jgi:hypothetical protein
MFYDLRGKPTPYHLIHVRSKPSDANDLSKWKRLNSFFHRGIVPVYSNFSGLLETEAKADLQRMFACVEDNPDHYMVESISGMSLQRLAAFVEQCQTFLVSTFGAKADELISYHRTELLKTKRITKN